jgi:hypothetical protein
MEDNASIDFSPAFLRHRQTCWILAVAGALPFIIPAVASIFLGAGNPLTGSLIEVFRSYSVVILSFLGGIRWGHVLIYQSEIHPKPANITLVMSVLPALIAWGTVFLGNKEALAILILAYAAQGAWDSLTANTGKLPGWFATLRIVLTMIAVACHMAVFAVAF